MAVRTSVPITKLNTFPGTAIPFANVDTVNGNIVNDTGRVILLVQSTATATVDIFLTSKPDLNARAGDITQTLAAGAIQAMGPFPDSSIWGDGTNLFVDFFNVGTKNPVSGQTLSQLKIAAIQF